MPIRQGPNRAQQEVVLVQSSSPTPTGPAGGDLAGTYPNPALATILSGAAGTVGSSTRIPAISFDTKGRITAIGDSLLSVLAHAASHESGGSDAFSIDQLTAPAADVAWNSKKITGLANGVNPQDAATFSQISTTIPAGGGANVDTSQTTASTSFTNLATVGPSVTVTTKTTALAFISANVANSTATFYSNVAIDISGATTRAADFEYALSLTGTTTGLQVGTCVFISGLTAGNNTFTLKYAVNAGTGTFLRRHIGVIPLPT